jgi:hypothetical protein
MAWNSIAPLKTQGFQDVINPSDGESANPATVTCATVAPGADPVLRPEAENMSVWCSREQVAALGGKKQKHSRLASRDQRHLFCFLRLSRGGTGRPPRLPTLSRELTSLQ